MSKPTEDRILQRGHQSADAATANSGRCQSETVRHLDRSVDEVANPELWRKPADVTVLPEHEILKKYVPPYLGLEGRSIWFSLHYLIFAVKQFIAL